jgi:hypothetical protein
MLSTRELARMRAEVLRWMPEIAQVLRWEPLTVSWVPVGSHPCGLGPKRSVTRGDSGLLEGVTLWQFHFPHNADIRVGDRITTGGHTYGVTGIDAGRSDALLLTVQAGRTA